MSMKDFTLDDVMVAVYHLPIYLGGYDPRIRISPPMLRELEGDLHVIFFAYQHGDSFPNYVYSVNTNQEELEAECLEVDEALEKFGIKEYPVEEEPDVPAGEEEEIGDLFWDSIDDEGHLVPEVYQRYLSTVIYHHDLLAGGYMWAFGGDYEA